MVRIPVGSRVRVTKIIDQDIIGTDNKERRRTNLFINRIGTVIALDCELDRSNGSIGQSDIDPLYIVKFDRVKCRTQVIDCFWIEELEVL